MPDLLPGPLGHSGVSGNEAEDKLAGSASFEAKGLCEQKYNIY